MTKGCQKFEKNEEKHEKATTLVVHHFVVPRPLGIGYQILGKVWFVKREKGLRQRP